MTENIVHMQKICVFVLEKAGHRKGNDGANSHHQSILLTWTHIDVWQSNISADCKCTVDCYNRDQYFSYKSLFSNV